MTETVSDSLVLVGRHLRHLTRVPTKLISVTVLPVVMVLVFGYLFGSAMTVPGGNYREYIMAGIFTQVMLSTVSSTAAGVAADLSGGMVDRFRSMPMARSSVLVGRTVADLLLSALACLMMAMVGLLIGWRVHHGLLRALGGFAVLLAAGFVFAWLGAFVGLAVRSAEAVTAVTFLLTVPFTFLSNAFIPLTGLPSWLRVAAEWNPVSAVVAALRRLWGNTGRVTGTSLPAEHPLPVALISLAVLLLLVIPAATRTYRTAVAR